MESKSKNKIAVIIPMYNEEKVAAKCIDAVSKVIKKINRPMQLIIVDDGSEDTTPVILRRKQKLLGKFLVIVTHTKNKGYGAGTQSGIKRALDLGCTWGIHMDSDLTNNPEDIPLFLKSIRDDIDCIKASRYLKESKILNVPFYRRLISLVGNSLASRLFSIGIKDCTNGFRMVRLSLLKNVEFKENNFSIILEELYYLKKKKAHFTEIPYTLTSRIDSLSHFNYKPKIFYDYFKYAIKSALLSGG